MKSGTPVARTNKKKRDTIASILHTYLVSRNVLSGHNPFSEKRCTRSLPDAGIRYPIDRDSPHAQLRLHSLAVAQTFCTIQPAGLASRAPLPRQGLHLDLQVQCHRDRTSLHRADARTARTCQKANDSPENDRSESRLLPLSAYSTGAISCLPGVTSSGWPCTIGQIAAMAGLLLPLLPLRAGMQPAYLQLLWLRQLQE
jgi:hypothetical protein